jgi:hypothetical protein
MASQYEEQLFSTGALNIFAITSLSLSLSFYEEKSEIEINTIL